MKDDEAYLLGACQQAGEFVGVDGMSEDRLVSLERKWVIIGWLEPETGKLTRKGMAAKGALFPLCPVSSEPQTYSVPIVELVADVKGEITIVDEDDSDDEPDETSPQFTYV